MRELNAIGFFALFQSFLCAILLFMLLCVGGSVIFCGKAIWKCYFIAYRFLHCFKIIPTVIQNNTETNHCCWSGVINTKFILIWTLASPKVMQDYVNFPSVGNSGHFILFDLILIQPMRSKYTVQTKISHIITVYLLQFSKMVINYDENYFTGFGNPSVRLSQK